jgi:hypothetical protein
MLSPAAAASGATRIRNRLIPLDFTATISESWLMRPKTMSEATRTPHGTAKADIQPSPKRKSWPTAHRGTPRRIQRSR